EVAAVRTKIESAEQTRDLRTRTTSQVSACRPQMRPLGNMPFVPRLGYMPARHGVILSDPCHPERPMSSWATQCIPSDPCHPERSEGSAVHRARWGSLAAVGGLRAGCASGQLASRVAPIAQLDRASDFGSEGWGFESLWAHW